MNFGAFLTDSQKKTWRDIWGCGQGIGPIREIVPVAALVQRLTAEYRQALASLAAPLLLRE
jgi:nitronate monooxygenase